MGIVETMVVKDKQGNVTVINASEFDAKLYTKVGNSSDGPVRAVPKKTRKTKATR